MRKTFWMFVTVFFIMVSLQSYSMVEAAAVKTWPTSKNTVCFHFEQTYPDAGDAGSFKLQSLPIGDNNYLLSGSNFTQENVANGSAVVKGTSILMTLNNSGSDLGSMWTNTVHVVLDSSTLNGTYEGIGHDKNYSDGSLDTEYASGTISIISCP